MIAIAIISFLLIVLKRDWYAIKVDDRSISAPTALGGRMSLLLEEITFKKTARENSSGWLVGERRVWGRGGNSIGISRWYFSLHEIKEILNAIGVPESSIV